MTWNAVYDGDTATVNGESWKSWEPDGEQDWSREFYISPCGRYLLKGEWCGQHGALAQFAVETMVWQQLAEEDRQFFSPVLASGFDGLHGWIITEFIQDAVDAENCDWLLHQEAERLFEKYDLTDYGDRQWKGTACSFVIHDYGVSPVRAISGDVENMLDSLLEGE